MAKNKSPRRSFKGWNIWKFLKGRRRMAVTLLGSILGFFAISQELEALLLGPVFEAIWSIIEYYFKEVR